VAPAPDVAVALAVALGTPRDVEAVERPRGLGDAHARERVRHAEELHAIVDQAGAQDRLGTDAARGLGLDAVERAADVRVEQHDPVQQDAALAARQDAAHDVVLQVLMPCERAEVAELARRFPVVEPARGRPCARVEVRPAPETGRHAVRRLLTEQVAQETHDPGLSPGSGPHP
jgi:hypothetical protein